MRNSVFRWTTGASIVLGVAVGGAIVQGLHAQAAPPVYVVVEISDITDPEGFKAVPAKSGPETPAAYVILTEKITPLDGTPPDRFVVIASTAPFICGLRGGRT
jgi:hypothetical protein